MDKTTRPSAEQMFQNMIGRTHAEEAQQEAPKVNTAAQPEIPRKKPAKNTVQVTVRLRPDQHKQLKAEAFHRDCDMSELVRQALDEYFE